MFAALLLVAIFSSALPFYAEAQGLPPKCDETVVAKIYEYWNKNGGIPQRVIERVSTVGNSTHEINSLKHKISLYANLRLGLRTTPPPT